MATSPYGRLSPVQSARAGLAQLRRPARDWALDVLVVIFVLPTAVPYLHREGLALGPLAAAYLLLATLPLLLRQIWPLPVFGWVSVLSIGSPLLDSRLVPNLAVLVAMYTVAARCPRARALAAAGLLELGGIAIGVHVSGGDWWFAAIFLTGLIVAALGLGLYSATHRAYLAELQERARQLERERDQQGELAAAAERSRIAREMHDIVAHHLTVIVALSEGLLASAHPTPQRAAQVLTGVSATGRQALADTRRLLGVLREPGQQTSAETPARQPLPDLAGIDTLIERVRSAGLGVSYEVRGPAAELPTGVQLTAYRIVQEALTNTLKHAGAGARAAVRLQYLPGEVRIEIEDDGDGAGPAAVLGSAATGPAGAGSGAGAGRGLSGMRERVQAYDGEVRSGPVQPRGWRVSAVLRLEQPAPA